MASVRRVLDTDPVLHLQQYLASGGGAGLRRARDLGADATIAEVVAAGVRGRGGAGFPTGVKWQTVAANVSPLEPTTVVVNAAEGEPGSFKDRALIARNPYRVLEGALIAAYAVGADEVIVGMKRTFEAHIARMNDAIDEVLNADLAPGISIAIFEGPPEYLLGEETGLLESIDGRMPFPRIAPPYRRGADEIVEHRSDVDDESASAAHVEMAGPSDEALAPPTLVDNVETLAHVALVLEHGADWFRELGTDQSPGTFVCTVSGDVRHAGVGEFPMGTPLREVIETLGGGSREERTIKAVLQGVSAPVLTADDLDTPLSWEGMVAAGSGLGAAAFIVFDDLADMAAVAAGVARFLAVESCGQCTPCKLDGITIADALDTIRRSEGTAHEAEIVAERLVTVADSARCSLATQHQVLVQSIVDRFASEFDAHLHGGATSRFEIAPLVDLVDGNAVTDPNQATKQPDWSHDEIWSGKSPADALDDHRAHQHL
ncbi:MAG TPA: NADH-ubiquinone oxidoreductase-F iron-sulfur binding region domain-containing protein [Acidimicrobiia bacterium]|nr:NADH-ubiquinone oxidoreductase-F iron-sulfur binding region domain-containing protein [Acidimicrobiia bacterium]